MAHAWKACWVNALGGSNPPSSALLTHPNTQGPGPRQIADRAFGLSLGLDFHRNRSLRRPTAGRRPDRRPTRSGRSTSPGADPGQARWPHRAPYGWRPAAVRIARTSSTVYGWTDSTWTRGTGRAPRGCVRRGHTGAPRPTRCESSAAPGARDRGGRRRPRSIGTAAPGAQG